MTKTDRSRVAGAALLRCGASLMVLTVAAAPLAAVAQSTVPQTPAPAGAPASDNASATNTNVSGDTSPTPNTDAGATQATDSAAPTTSDIIVTGTRQALQTSQNVKRNADTVVDTITATDIGAFPDKSAAESLQRVPGITVNRFAASDDTSHFGAEPSQVLVRGLTQVRTEINGRDSFSANSSRGLSFEDIAPELLAGIDTYKNQTAELIEGGIAGSINLRTRVPFDSTGQVIQGNVNANIGDIRRRLTPEFSGLYSNRWQTGIGEFGFLGDYSYSKVKTESQAVIYGRTAVFDNVYGPGRQYIPSSVGLRDTQYDRTRNGTALAGQWRDNSGAILATAQYNRSKYHETFREHGVISYLTDLFAFPANFAFTKGGPNASRIPQPAPGSPAFTFDSAGNFETGLLTNQQTDFSWWGGADYANDPLNFTGVGSDQIARNSLGQVMLHPCYSWGNAVDPVPPFSCGVDARGPDLNAVTRFNDIHRKTQDASFNIKWEASDRLHFNFDAQYVDATVNNYDVEVGQYSFANVFLDASKGKPTITLSSPTQISQSPGGLSNPNNYRYNHVMDHVEDDNGTEWAFRGDASYDIGSDWLDSIKVGARYADRDQTVRYSAFNWGNIANNYNTDVGQYRYWNIDSYTPNGNFKGYPKGLIDVRTLGGDFFGSNNQYAFFDMKQLEKHAADGLSYSSIGVGQDQWEPICSGGGTAKTGPRTGETDGCFRPDEINKVSEATKAAYAILKFGGKNAEIFGLGFAGNIGVRYVETKNKVSGSTVYPTAFSPATQNCTRRLPVADQAPSPIIYSAGCYLYGNAALIASRGAFNPANPVDPVTNVPTTFVDIPLSGSPNVVAFNNGGSFASTVRTTHRNWLPSFNLRVDLSPKWLVRFAASRALSRPDLGLLKNYTTVQTFLPGNDATDPRYIKNAAGQITGINATYQAGGYNPSLKPITATQFDISVENYFASVGSFTAAAFYKKFQNYIQYGSRFVDLTNNGVTNSVELREPQNGKGGKIYGFEVAYQRFFDFLPGALSGLGVQANGTYVHNSGITNSGLKTQNGTSGGSQAQPGSGGTTLAVNSLEGLSKYAYNLVGMYEKYGLAVRAAYNWRSKYLVTAVDCCTYLPTYQKAAGFLDASIRYAVNDHVEISVQGSNLLNTQTKLQQQVSDDSSAQGVVLTPNAWLQNDRRYVFGARVKF